MDIEKLKKQLDDFANERDWNQLHTPKNLSMALCVEASELVEIFQWLTPEQSNDIMSYKHGEHVGEEIADIMIYLVRMCDKLNLDLDSIIQEKIIKNAIKHEK